MNFVAFAILTLSIGQNSEIEGKWFLSKPPISHGVEFTKFFKDHGESSTFVFAEGKFKQSLDGKVVSEGTYAVDKVNPTYIDLDFEKLYPLVTGEIRRGKIWKGIYKIEKNKL